MIFQTTKKRRKKYSVFITWHLCAENYTPATRHTHTQTHTKKNISKIDGEEVKLESTHTNKMTSKFEVGLRSFIILFSLPFFPCSLSCGLFLTTPPPRTSILPKTVIFKWLLVHTCRTSAIETISSDWIEHLKTIEIADVQQSGSMGCHFSSFSGRFYYPCSAHWFGVKISSIILKD